MSHFPHIGLTGKARSLILLTILQDGHSDEENSIYKNLEYVSRFLY